MQCKSPDTRIYEELTSLNAGLLRLLVWRERPDAPGLPRLAPAISSQLRELTREELDFIAGTPALLAAKRSSPPLHRSPTARSSTFGLPGRGRDLCSELPRRAASESRPASSRTRPEIALLPVPDRRGYATQQQNPVVLTESCPPAA